MASNDNQSYNSANNHQVVPPSAPVSPTQGSSAPPHPQVVYVSRPLDPHDPVISEEVMKRHKESVEKYSELNLSKGEYVISAIKRHPIGLIEIWGVVALLGSMMILLIAMFASNEALMSTFTNGSLPIAPLIFIALLLLILFVIGGFIATIVYNDNKFFLTNESVTQIIRTSLFSRKEQTISLSNIEDASFRQHGILQHLLGYGSLRLSTEGDETTYRFNYVANPKQQVTRLNDAVEAFKNGRPLD